MCISKTNAPLLLLWSMVSISLARVLSTVHIPPDFQVLSPSEFKVILDPEEKGRLMVVRVGINKDLGFSKYNEDFESKKAEGGTINFSNSSLNLKKGDKISYVVMFDDGNEGTYGHTGHFVFDGVFKGKERRKRDVYEDSSEETSDEETANQDIDTRDRGTGRYLKRHGPPHGHFNPHGPPPHGHFDPHGPPHGHGGHFAPPPYGSPHDPPPHPGPGSWKGHGHDGKDHFGNSGPWDRNDDDDNCDTHGSSPGSDRRPDNKRPWGGGNGSKNNGNGGSDNPYGDKKPNRGNGFGSNPSFGSDGNSDTNMSGSDGSKNNKGTDNPNVEVFTTRRPSTTQKTTTVPDIDIRFRVPEDS